MSTRQVMTAYLSDHAEGLVGADATFTLMGSNQSYTGLERIHELLTYFYSQAFDAHAEVKSLYVDGDGAVAECAFIGVHIGEFMGIPATHKAVNVPMCIVYTLADGLIQSAHIYFESDALRAQLGV